MLSPDNERDYLGMARDNPGILCSEVPHRLLEAASLAGEEPSPFFIELFAIGYLEWLSQKEGKRVRLPREELDQAVLALWTRACHLHTSLLLDKPNPDWTEPFFSDEGLY